MSDEGSDRTWRDDANLLKLIPVVLLLAVLVLFAAANTQRTNVDLVFTETSAPLFAVLLGTAVVGALLAAMFRFERRHHN